MFNCESCGKKVDKVYKASVLDVPVVPGWCAGCMKYELGIDVDTEYGRSLEVSISQEETINSAHPCCDGSYYDSYCDCCTGQCNVCGSKCPVCKEPGFYEEGESLYCELHVPSSYWSPEDPRSQQPLPGVDPFNTAGVS